MMTMRTARRLLALSQQELSAITDLSQTVISQIEGGRRSPSPSQRRRTPSLAPDGEGPELAPWRFYTGRVSGSHRKPTQSNSFCSGPPDGLHPPSDSRGV